MFGCERSGLTFEASGSIKPIPWDNLKSKDFYSSEHLKVSELLLRKGPQRQQVNLQLHLCLTNFLTVKCVRRLTPTLSFRKEQVTPHLSHSQSPWDSLVLASIKKKENPFSSSEEAAANTLLLPSIWSQRGRRNKSSSASKSADKSRKKGKKKGNTKEKGNRFCLTLRKNFIFVVSGFSCRNRLLCINGWRTSDMFIRWTKSCKWI